jgi:hypothetical protein
VRFVVIVLFWMQFERTNFLSVSILIGHETILEILRSLYVHKVSCIKFATMLMFEGAKHAAVG